jgi:hypothetical protein
LIWIIFPCDRLPMARALLIVVLLACTSRPPALHDDPQAMAYRSRSKVRDADARQIAAEAVGDARRRPAWSEPNHVHAADGPFGDGQDKYLFGEARLYLGEYETDPGKFREVDAKDDALMAYADAIFTVQQLQEWAQRYGLSWEVQLGRSRGRVEASGADASAKKLLAELSRKAGVTAEQAELQRRRVDQKYRDRR